jgi:histidinol-phosphate aminotransferase
VASSWPKWLPIRDSLRDRTPYGAPQINATARLNTNENPYPLPHEVSSAISRSIERVITDLNRYPDRDAIDLRTSLAGYVKGHIAPSIAFSITQENIWPANGSNEILQSILMAFGERVAGFSPSYSMHPILTEALGKSFEALPLGSDFTPNLEELRTFIASKQPTLFFVTTPNNPTGRSLGIGEIEEIATLVAEVNGLLVVDEAYGEFSRQESAATLIHRHPHVVVVRTMSKAFAFAGARIGYAIAHEEVIKALQLVRLPYHLSAITQAAGIAAIEHADRLLREVDRLKSARDHVASKLMELGLEVVPSDANFILFGGLDRLSPGTPERVWQALLDDGVLIRDVGIAGHLRVTIGTDEENTAFIKSLTRILAS